jgi:predicted O-methyltransferase YrrM
MELGVEQNLNTDNWFNYQNFYKMISEKDFNVFVEVGAWKGHSICYLGNLLKDKNVKIYAVDLWDETYKYEDNPRLKKQKVILHDIFKQNLKNNGLNDKIIDIKSLSWEAASNFRDEEVDFVFIDADHEYESVIKDIKAWLPKIKKNGIISGHDYFNPCGVKKAVDEIFGDNVMFNGTCWFVEL